MSRSSLFLWIVIALCVCPAGMLLAVTFTVDSTADETDLDQSDGLCLTAGGQCTLRAAIQQANFADDADVITVPAGTYAFTLGGQNEDSAATGDLDIIRNLAINGAGQSDTVVNASGLDRAFHILSGVVSISNLTVTGGNSDLGGGILNQGSGALTAVTVQSGSATAGGGVANLGPLAMTLCNVTGNSATESGGILNQGDLAITDSVVTGNTVTGTVAFGGGISNVAPGILTVTACTISGNAVHDTLGPTGGRGGGITNSGSITIMSSTLSGNNVDAIGQGGGIFNSANITMNNSTVSGNSSGADGAGIYNASTGTLQTNNATVAYNTTSSGNGGGIFNATGGTVQFENTIIGANSGGGTPDCSGSLESRDFNLIQNISGCTLTGTTTDNKTGLDPLLGPLQNNGGLTLTHALLDGSGAVDSGNDGTCQTTDQRGVLRPQGASCDMGSYEAVSKLYYDDFEDGDASDWTYTKGSWSVVSGSLVGTYDAKADNLSPFSGCSVCTVESDMTAVTPQGRVSLLAWYVDKKNNVELIMMDDKDKFVLKQKVNGEVLAKTKFQQVINPLVSYNVQISYDGAGFRVSVDGTEVFGLPAAALPSGTVGFRVKSTTKASTTVSFRQISVY